MSKGGRGQRPSVPTPSKRARGHGRVEEAGWKTTPGSDSCKNRSPGTGHHRRANGRLSCQTQHLLEHSISRRVARVRVCEGREGREGKEGGCSNVGRCSIRFGDGLAWAGSKLENLARGVAHVLQHAINFTLLPVLCQGTRNSGHLVVERGEEGTGVEGRVGRSVPGAGRKVWEGVPWAGARTQEPSDHQTVVAAQQQPLASTRGQ